MEKITADDIRYNDLANKRFNKRFQGKPEYIVLPETTEDVIDALQEAIDENKRPVVRSGGHCLEGFVSDPAVQVVIDTSLMTTVDYDAEKKAFIIEAGVTVGEMYRQLFLKWGVVLPAGEHPAIGVGGHILGGAFGFLCREYGLAADYLYAVELVGVNSGGKAYSVIATREANDPNRELWWAHTGAGGGNFGIVTRYWLRAVDSDGSDPYTTLPKAPSRITTFQIAWEWKDVTEPAFTALAKNFGEWCFSNSSPGTTANQLFSILFLYHRNVGKLELKGLATGDDSKDIIDEHLSAVLKSVDIKHSKKIEEFSWLKFALNPFPELFQPGMDSGPVKVKDSFFRKPLTDTQIATAYKYVTQEAPVGGAFAMATYGGKVNSIASDATASAQRDCIMDVACNTGWADPNSEAPSLNWVRNFYKDLFADTGGVPVPNEQTGGCMINHPDTDTADPEWNKSEVPWSALYYHDNYPRLQQVKERWDPKNIFYHALSIRAK